MENSPVNINKIHTTNELIDDTTVHSYQSSSDANPNEIIEHTSSINFEDNINTIFEYIDNENYDALLNYTEFKLDELFDMIDDVEKFVKNEQLVLTHIINNAQDIEVNIGDELKIIHAVLLYAPNLLSILINKGVNIESTIEPDMTPLHFIIKENKFDVAKLLIKFGANYKYVDSTGWNVVHFACRTTNLDMVIYFVELLESDNNKILQVPTQDNWYPIHFACEQTNIDIIKYLISKGCDLNVKTRNGWEPLHMASASSNYDIIKYIIDSGVDRSVKVHTYYGNTNVNYNYLNLIKLNKNLTKIEKNRLYGYKRNSFKKRKCNRL